MGPSMSQANRFRRGSGCYTCDSCKRKTRATGGDNDSLRLCIECYEIAGLENSISDHGDPSGRHAADIARLTESCRGKGGAL